MNNETQAIEEATAGFDNPWRGDARPARRKFLAASAIGAAGVIGFAKPAAAQANNAGSGAGFAVTVAASNAPQSMKDNADFVCNGNNDQATINSAMASIAQLGGVVALSPGNFNCKSPVKTRKRISLVGSGRSTRLIAKFGGYGAVIVADGTNEDKMEVANLAIIGEGNDTHGIQWHITSSSGFDEGSPDSSNRIADVYISNVKRSGVYISGGSNRAIMVERVRVLNAGQHAFNIRSADGFYDQCDAGSSGLAGFLIVGSNNRFTSCKAWFSDRSGFIVDAVRNQFSACEAQDNERHGFEINLGQNSFSSCHADSNSWKPNAPQSSYDGFYLKRGVSWVQLSACQAYEKQEGGRGKQQRYGFHLAGNNAFCQISGSARDNRVGKLRDNSNSSTSSIDVVGP